MSVAWLFRSLLLYFLLAIFAGGTAQEQASGHSVYKQVPSAQATMEASGQEQGDAERISLEPRGREKPRKDIKGDGAIDHTLNSSA